MKKHFNFIFSTFKKVDQNKNFVRKAKNKKASSERAPATLASQARKARKASKTSKSSKSSKSSK